MESFGAGCSVGYLAGRYAMEPLGPATAFNMEEMYWDLCSLECGPVTKDARVRGGCGGFQQQPHLNGQPEPCWSNWCYEGNLAGPGVYQVPPPPLHMQMKHNSQSARTLKSRVNNNTKLSQNGLRRHQKAATTVCNSPDCSKCMYECAPSCALAPPLNTQRPPHSGHPVDLLFVNGEFTSNDPLTFKLEFIRGRCVEFAADQRGSRLIQQAIEEASCEDKQAIFEEILPETLKLTNHIFGNYVIQKFFEFGSPTQKLFLLEKLQESILVLAKEVYGCRVIQKAVEVLPPEMQAEIIEELDGHILECAMEQNGNHVIQKCIEYVDPILLKTIVHAVIGNVFKLAVHPFGCRVVQRILERCGKQLTDEVLEELLEHTPDLVQNQYGNYVIQHVLEHGQSEHRSQIIMSLKGKVMELSKHKYASNVIEKCLIHGSQYERSIFIQEMYEHESDLLLLTKDQYANYVIQKAIDTAEPSQRKILLYKLKPYLPVACKCKYAKSLVKKVNHFVSI